MTMTSTLSYFKRLGLHGSRLLWRVLMVLVTVIGAAVWGMLTSFSSKTFATGSEDENKDSVFGEYPDGTPWVENVEHESWQNVYGKDVSRV